VHDDIGTHRLLFAGLDGVAVHTGGLPPPRLLLPVLSGDHGDLVGHHKRGIEAHAELTDDIGVRRGLAVHLLPEPETAGGGDDAQIVLQLVPIHTDAVVADGQRAGGLVGLEFDRKIAAAEADFLVGQRLIGQLVDGVGGVGNDFTQENFLMRVNGVYHEIQQTLGFRLELFLCHSKCHVLCRLALILSEC